MKINHDYELYNADAYKLIQKLISRGVYVDHIITDPPYNISKDNNFGTMRNKRTGVNFGEWDSGLFNLYSWIPKYAKILRPNGSMIIFCSYRFISKIIDVIELPENDLVVKDVIIWQKSNPMPRNINRRYVQDMEFAIWAVRKKGKWIFNKPEDVPYLRSLYTTSTVSGKEKLGHPTQKSLKLMKNIISVHTNIGQTILDPFMGCGSTGAAAISLGRKFIGIEIDKGFYNMANDRIEGIENEII